MTKVETISSLALQTGKAVSVNPSSCSRRENYCRLPKEVVWIFYLPDRMWTHK